MSIQNQFVSYLRVSTTRQGADGLGIAAQRHAVETCLRSGQGKLLAEFVEVESGRRTDRPELDKAVALCRKYRATLLIARLDRLARNATFLLGLQDSGVSFQCCDMPEVKDRFTLGVLALVAEREAQLIGARTRAALQAAKRRGTRLGNPNLNKLRPSAIAANRRKVQEFAAQLAPVLAEIKAAGVSTLKGIAKALTARGIKTPMGGRWSRQAVSRIQRRLA